MHVVNFQKKSWIFQMFANSVGNPIDCPVNSETPGTNETLQPYMVENYDLTTSTPRSRDFWEARS